MNPEKLVDEIEERYAERYRLDQMARVRLAIRPRTHTCCFDQCEEMVGDGQLWCGEHEAYYAHRRGQAVKRWRRLFGWLMGMMG
jgi:hypothetical protein